MSNKYEPLKIEPEILKYWEKHSIYPKAKKKNKGNKQFYFLDGPPYTSGKVHLGTAWNKSLKDAILRFKRMQGLDVWDRAGYDMHGLPTEQGVERELGIKHKEEIPKFGVAKFIKACDAFAEKNMKIMNKDFTRLGVWMEFEEAYQTRKNEWIEGEWWLVKKAHENKRLYEGEKTMHWCARCGTSLSKHELEYKNVSDDSIFVKFPIRGKKNEFLVVWTTTPWTIPFNLGVMVSPKIDYIKAKVEDEVWIVAKTLAPIFIQGVADKKFEIINEFKGDKLEGLKYDHPFADQIKKYEELEKEHPNTLTVVLSDEYVDVSAGSGLVHMAPGCGPEDYEVGHKNHIPPYNTLTEAGVFEDVGEFTGLVAKKDDKKFIEALEDRNALIATTQVDHEYAHCDRCKTPVIYKTTKQWFFKIEDLKVKMRKLNKKIGWVPYTAGAHNFDKWIENLRDNGITRQRYWGTPLPVWKCENCDDYTVVGSMKELKKLAGEIPDNLHKPWIDKVEFPCKCGSTKKRSPDVLDVWIDAGSASWNCLYFPQREDFFKKLYPADFILEGIDQIRGWFNLLFVASMVAMENNSFDNVYMHGFINDAKGRKMSKSMGNYIVPEEVVDKYGADTFRLYTLGGTNAGLDLNYNFEDMKVKHKNLTVLWNIHNFIFDLAKNIYANPAELKIKKEDLGLEEKFILSKLNSTIKIVTQLYEEYKIDEVPEKIEELFLDLSRTYIQLVREKASVGTEDEKKVVLHTIYTVMFETLKIFTTVAPFICEKMFLNFKDAFNVKEESISHYPWPKSDKSMIDENIEKNMGFISNIIQGILSGREKIQQGVRWPLKEVLIVTENKNIKHAIKELGSFVYKQTNVKSVEVKKELQGIKVKIKADFGKLGPEFGDATPKIISEITKTSTESIMNNLDKKGKHEVKVNGKKYDIKKDHLIIERVVPKPYVEVPIRNGFIYINTELDDDLLSEGYARELMRRVQVLRKNSGLQKSDEINLFVQVDKNVIDMVKRHSDMIKEKVGAKEITFDTKKPDKKFKNSSQEKIKGKKFGLFMEKV